MIDGKINVLFVASECAPLCKTGGLADVVGALPKALSKNLVKSSIILPYYSVLPKEVRQRAKLIAHFTVDIGIKKQYAGLLKVNFRNRTYYFIDNEEYFKRDNLYGYYEDCERYIFFSLAVLKALEYIDDIDIVHCNDWQTALIPTLLRKFYSKVERYRKIKTVFTIHNLRFQGNMNLDDFINMIGLKGSEDWLNEITHYKKANLLKSALYNADIITTVSRNYAEEIKYKYYGETLEGCINEVSYKIKGIVNGIDVSSFNPNDDSKIYLEYSDIEGKKKNKKMFLNEYNLTVNSEMIIGMVTRLDSQKGLDLVLHAINEILKMPVKFILLGTGEKTYEKAFADLERKYPEKVRSFIMYDDNLARKIYASSDVFLMPSMFEPCGLGQMIAMRYGSLPIVRETGGLSDTVMPYNEITGEGTGFSFKNYNGDELLSTVKYANDIFTKKNTQFNIMATRAMNTDFSWNKSAKEYKKLYLEIMK